MTAFAHLHPGRFGLLFALLLLLSANLAAATGLGLRIRDAPMGGGAEITDVAADSVAARAGLQMGDLIREAGGHPIAGASELVRILKSQGAGQSVPLTVERSGWRRNLILGPVSETSETHAPGPSSALHLGLRVAEDVSEAGGPRTVRIIGIEPGSPAADAGLAAGDQILEAQGHAINGAGEFASVLQGLDGSAPLELRISRDGWQQTVGLTREQAAPGATGADSAGAGRTGPAPEAQDPCHRGRLGIQIQDSPGKMGVDIVDVDPEGAAAGKLRRGDRIVAIEGRTISSTPDLLALVNASQPGQLLTLGLERGKARLNLDLRTGKPSRFDCLLMKGDLQLEGEHWDEAARLYDEAIRVYPERPAGWEKKALLHDRKGDLAGAIESDRRALKAVGEIAAIHARIARNQQRLGSTEDARASAERALRLDAHNPLALYTLASLAIDRQDWNEALDHLHEYLEQNPGVAHAWGDLGVVMANLGRDEEAMSAYRHCLEIEPGNATARLNLALSLRKQGREQEAAVYLRQAAELDPRGEVGRMAGRLLTPDAGNSVNDTAGEAATARADGRRASVAVGDFQVKAAKANQQIGDGLREMFLTALHQSGYFNVVERMGIQDIAAEQALSRSGMADSGAALPGGQMEVADIMVYGVVSEFEPEAGGLSFSNFLPQMGFAVRQSSKFSEMAIDVRAVDVRTGRVLVAKRIPGTAQAYSGGLGASLGIGGISMPVSLGTFRNTPMELAIRDCIQKATYFVINQIPQEYFRNP